MYIEKSLMARPLKNWKKKKIIDSSTAGKVICNWLAKITTTNTANLKLPVNLTLDSFTDRLVTIENITFPTIFLCFQLFLTVGKW